MSILTQRPFTLQEVLETVLQRGWTKPELLPAAYYTTVAWFMAYTFSIFSYLVGGLHLGNEEAAYQQQDMLCCKLPCWLFCCWSSASHSKGEGLAPTAGASQASFSDAMPVAAARA